VISASIIVLVIRTQRPFFKSLPGTYLFVATIAIVLVTLIFPFIPVREVFGFVPLPGSFLAMMGLIVALYIFMTEWVKKIFYQKVNL
jgi:Mg2+-importing ATPase